MNYESASFAERQARFKTAFHKGTPDRVPVFPMIEQWAHFATGTSIVDSYTKDPAILVDCFRKLYEDVYVDVTYGTGNLKPVKLLDTVGNSLYKINETGVMIEGGKGATMEADEYAQLIANPSEFIMNVILPRKYPKLREKESAIETWHQGLKDVLDWLQYNAVANAGVEQELGVPIVVKGGTYIAPDVILDFFRDFQGIMVDIRRRPQDVLDACEAIYPMMINGAKSWTNPSDDGGIFMPLHLPTFLRPKDFAKFYYPYLKRTTEDLWKMGMPSIYYCENDWTPYLDLMQDMPEDGLTLGIFEKGDWKLIKEKLSKSFCFAGGLKLETLKLGTPEQCIDEAKWCLDNLAPGGNYIYCTDINLCYAKDAKLENLAAVTNWVHENGKY